MQLVVPLRPPAPVIETEDTKRALEVATDPVEIKEINAKLDAFEQYMHDCGLYSVEDMRPINETRMAARWKLGKALAKVDRAQGERTSVRSFTKFIADLGITKPVAVDAQRIGALPDEEMHRAFERAREERRLLHYGELIILARPWWYQENRRARHKAIREGASKRMVLERPGPFRLIYADPPWVSSPPSPTVSMLSV